MGAVSVDVWSVGVAGGGRERGVCASDRVYKPAPATLFPNHPRSTGTTYPTTRPATQPARNREKLPLVPQEEDYCILPAPSSNTSPHILKVGGVLFVFSIYRDSWCTVLLVDDATLVGETVYSVHLL